MKQFLTTTAIATVFAGSAIAGAVEYVAPVEAAVVTSVEPATDWSGAYIGGLYGAVSGTQTDTFDGIYYDEVYQDFDLSFDNDIDGNMYGAFAGYGFQRGSIVFGVETAYSMGSVGFDSGLESFYQEEENWGAHGWGLEGDYESITDIEGGFTSFIDLKARAGFAAGNALIYGFAGWSLGQYEYTVEFYEEFDESYTTATSGMNYGVGIDYLVTDSIFLGAEYIIREQAGDVYSWNEKGEEFNWSMDASVQALQVRAGMRF